MGTTNWGSQTITVKFGAPVNSNIVNARHVQTRPVGVYRGGIVVNNNATATVSPFVAEVADRNGLDAQIRVRTANPVTIGWTGTQFLVLRWDYAEDTEANYVDIMSVDSPDPYDVILAQRSGTTSINYERRMAAGQRGDFLRVLPAFPSHLPRTVYIKSGVIQTPNGSVLVNDAQITNLTQGNRFIYVDISDNNVKSTATKSTADANIILARVRVPDLVTPIDESMIDDLRVFLSPLAVPDNETIQYIGGRLAVPNDGLDGNKVLLNQMGHPENGDWLRGMNNNGSTILNLIRVGTNNNTELRGPIRLTGSVNDIQAANHAATKEYVDAQTRSFDFEILSLDITGTPVQEVQMCVGFNFDATHTRYAWSSVKGVSESIAGLFPIVAPEGTKITEIEFNHANSVLTGHLEGVESPHASGFLVFNWQNNQLIGSLLACYDDSHGGSFYISDTTLPGTKQMTRQTSWPNELPIVVINGTRSINALPVFRAYVGGYGDACVNRFSYKIKHIS